jgi:O-antigen ligase
MATTTAHARLSGELLRALMPAALLGIGAVVAMVVLVRVSSASSSPLASGGAVLALGLGAAIFWGLLRNTTAGVLVWLVVALFAETYAQIGIPLDRLLFLALFGGWLLAVMSRERRARLGLIEGLMLLYVALMALSAFAGHKYDAAVVFPPDALLATSAVFPFALFVIARSTMNQERHMRAFLWVVIGIGFYLAMINIFQEVGLNALVYPQNILDPSLGVNPERARGPLLNSAADGVVLVIAFVAALYMASRDELRWRRLALIAAIPMPIGIFLTETRAVWLAAGIAVIVAIMFARGFRVWYVAIALVGVAFIGANWQQFLSSDRSSGGVTSSSEIESRLNDIATLNAAIADKPLTGWGISRYPEVNTHRHEAWGDVRWDAGFGFIAHNTPLVVAAEIGLVALGVWLAILIAIIVATGRAWRQLPRSGLASRGFILTVWLVMMIWFLNSLVIDMRVFGVINAMVFTWAGIAVGLVDRAEEAAAPIEDLAEPPGVSAP